MPDGLLTGILLSFKTIFIEGVKNLTPYAISLIVSLAGLQVLISQMWLLLGDGEKQLETLLKNIVKIGLFLFFVTNYVMLIDQVQESFVKIGLIAGGNRITAAMATDPSYVSDMGAVLMDKIYSFSATGASQSDVVSLVIAAAKGELTVAKLFPNLFYFACSFFVWAAFLVIAIQVFLTYLEFYIFGAIIPMLLPFGVFKYTSFIAEKSFGAIVGAGVKISVLIFILSATIPLVETWTLPENPTNAECLRLLGGSVALAFLCWHAPSMAASVMSGGPSLNSGAISGAVGAGMAGVMAGGALISAVKTGVVSGMSAYSKITGGGGTADENIANTISNDRKIEA